MRVPRHQSIFIKRAYIPASPASPEHPRKRSPEMSKPSVFRIIIMRHNKTPASQIIPGIQPPARQKAQNITIVACRTFRQIAHRSRRNRQINIGIPDKTADPGRPPASAPNALQRRRVFAAGRNQQITSHRLHLFHTKRRHPLPANCR